MEPIDFLIHTGRSDTADAIREYASRRVAFALRPFEQRVRRVKLRLIDLNGPRQGLDSRCSITVDLVNGRRIFVDATTAWPFASVTRAAGRLSAAVRHELKRSASRRGLRPGSSV
jgi:putative sigma-54 modulation protein